MFLSGRNKRACRDYSLRGLRAAPRLALQRATSARAAPSAPSTLGPDPRHAHLQPGGQAYHYRDILSPPLVWTSRCGPSL